MKNTSTPPSQKLSPASAELFIATGCAHCPNVLSELSNQLKTGKLSALQITNIAVNNERAAQLNIRSVPWFRLENSSASMIFPGNYTAKEIAQWVAATTDKKGMSKYIEEFLGSGNLLTVIQAIEMKPETFSSVIDMLEDEETGMETRIGLDALLENFTATEILQTYAPRLKKMADENNVRLQIDALHYLALTGDAAHKTFINSKTKDKDKQIQEAAIEALETLDELLE